MEDRFYTLMNSVALQGIEGSDTQSEEETYEPRGHLSIFILNLYVLLKAIAISE